MYRIRLIGLLAIFITFCSTISVLMNTVANETLVETTTGALINTIEPIYLYGFACGQPENINNYNDVIELFKKEYNKYINRDYYSGWANLLSGIGNKCYYSIFDIDNNGVDEIILFTDKNSGCILYMFTMHNGKPFCLINCEGDHEIGYYTYYSLIGDNIIGKTTNSNIDFTESSYYTMENNHLILIEKLYDGYVEDDEGNYNSKLIYTKDGIEKEISYEESQSLLSHYNQITVNKRKVLECSLDIDTDDFINTQ